jgi:hypothetical protein
MAGRNNGRGRPPRHATDADRGQRRAIAQLRAVRHRSGRGDDLMGGVAAHRPGRGSHKKSAAEVLGMPNGATNNFVVYFCSL